MKETGETWSHRSEHVNPRVQTRDTDTRSDTHVTDRQTGRRSSEVRGPPLRRHLPPPSLPPSQLFKVTDRKGGPLGLDPDRGGREGQRERVRAGKILGERRLRGSPWFGSKRRFFRL